ncbi:hypothetical protein LCGC14_1945610 [marine sediment metagenome]|uniref:Uncharacterized protein n=1 Tax=marine sediment metagenome TaxID=412755 RepID=A0A0F9FIZ2_9ZZZZ
MYYQRFAVVGVINVTTLDAGLVSLVEEPVRITAILLTVSDYADDIIEGWIGNERVMECPDYIFDTDALEATMSKSTTKIIRLPIEQEIPPGQIFKAGVRCGAVAIDLFGAYEYEKVE